MFARITVLFLCSTLQAALPIEPALAQQDGASDSAEMYFARLAFGSYGGRFGSGRGEAWLRDWPEADFHFMQGVRRLTLIESSTEGRQVQFNDDSMFDHPVIYAVKVGFMRLNDDEALSLREYLLRGGFLIVDDFHGPGEWIEFAASMHRIFPDRPIVELPTSDEVFHVLYDLDQRTQIPGVQAVMSGRTWEHADDPRYPESLTALAYRFGINYLIYAMTH